MDQNMIILCLILLVCLINTFLLVKHVNKVHESFETHDRTSTRVGPYDGVTSCSSWGIRNVNKGDRPIGDDSFIFNGFPNKAGNLI